MQLYDARGNEYSGVLDHITGQTLTDARTATANLAALNAEALVDLNGQSTVGIDVRGTFVGTFVCEATIDGTNYFAIPMLNYTTELYILSATAATVATCEVAGFRRVRIRCSAYTSGTMVVAMRATRADFLLYAKPIPSTLLVTVTAAANTAATITLPSVTGQFHYITSLHISRNATAALAGTATLVITSTNLPGSAAWSVGNAMAAGETRTDIQMSFPNPIKSSAVTTATTIVMPAPGLAVLWRGVCTYYVGN